MTIKHKIYILLSALLVIALLFSAFFVLNNFAFDQGYKDGFSGREINPTLNTIFHQNYFEGYTSGEMDYDDLHNPIEQ